MNYSPRTSWSWPRLTAKNADFTKSWRECLGERHEELGVLDVGRCKMEVDNKITSAKSCNCFRNPTSQLAWNLEINVLANEQPTVCSSKKVQVLLTVMDDDEKRQQD